MKNNSIFTICGSSDYTITFLDILHLQSVCNRGREKIIKLIETCRNTEDLINFALPYIKLLNKNEKDLLNLRNKLNYFEGLPDNKSIEERMNIIEKIYEDKFKEFTY